MDHDLGAAARRELIMFVNAAGGRRVLPTVFHVGRPGARRGSDHAGIPEDPGLDPGLRADLVERLLEDPAAEPDPLLCAWVTRSGALAPSDADLAWFAASSEGFARHGLTLPGFFVITRFGWIDLTADSSQEVQVRRTRRRRRA